MKCRKCNSEIPDGELICPRCGAEINLVPDYRPVEFMIDEKKREDKAPPAYDKITVEYKLVTIFYEDKAHRRKQGEGLLA